MVQWTKCTIPCKRGLSLTFMLCYLARYALIYLSTMVSMVHNFSCFSTPVFILFAPTDERILVCGYLGLRHRPATIAVRITSFNCLSLVNILLDFCRKGSGPQLVLTRHIRRDASFTSGLRGQYGSMSFLNTQPCIHNSSIFPLTVTTMPATAKMIVSRAQPT